MDPATIAASAAALLAPYLKQIAEDFVGEAGKYVQGKARSLWQKLSSRLEGDPATKATLDKFENNPEAYRDEFQETIRSNLAKDSQLSQELASELAEIKRKAPHVRVVQTMTDAENVVGVKAKKLNQGTVEVNQTFDKGRDIGGVELDEIG
jgi:hypothetical protein